MPTTEEERKEAFFRSTNFRDSRVASAGDRRRVTRQKLFLFTSFHSLPLTEQKCSFSDLLLLLFSFLQVQTRSIHVEGDLLFN